MASSIFSKHEFFSVHKPVEYVAHVEINRPAKLNAFIQPMWLELREVFDSLSTDAEVRAVVLTGAGDRAFSAGLDVQAAGSSLFQTSTLDGSRQAAAKRRHITEFQGCVSAIERCEKPVICAMHGYAFGLAIDIAVCADVRLCSADAVFAVKEVDIGLAADVGSLNRLPKIVGNFGWVKDVCLTARQFRPAEAEKVGFVTGVYPDKAQAVTAAIEWASLVATKSPVAVQGTKELLNWSRDRNVQDGLRYTAVWNGAALQSSDVQSAMKAGIEKKRPRFEKL